VDSEKFTLHEIETRTATLDAEDNLNLPSSDSAQSMLSLCTQPLAYLLYSLIKNFDSKYRSSIARQKELQ